MLDIDTKRRIDTARDILVGKVPDPKSQVEQITIALIYKFMNDIDAESEYLGGERRFFVGEFAKYRWANLIHAGLGGHETLNLYAEALTRIPENPNIPQLFREIFGNVFLPYRDPETLRMFLNVIDEFTYDHSERLGDAFEYLLSVMGSQGDAGQFRTPRHIIDFMVKIIDPQKHERVLDPACGTAGFLISAYKHIRDASNDDAGQPTLTPDENARLASNLVGYDISPDMARLSRVNMYLHGFPRPNIHEYDTLTSEERWEERADVILANPPFMSPKGGIRPHSKFSVQSRRSEVLFVDYIAEHLTPGGRAAVIVPEGVIFQSQNAHKQLRKMLVEDYLVAVVSLPAGVFQPYSGVKTSILIMDKTLARRAKSIAFFKVENDGYDLGAQRRPIAEDDLPAVEDELAECLRHLQSGDTLDGFRTAHGFVVDKGRIGEDGEYNLSGERYRDTRPSISNWPMVALSDACIVNPRKSEISAMNGATTVSFVPMSDMGENSMYFAAKDSKILREVGSSYTYFRDDDVLVAKVTPCFENGKAGIAKNLENGIGFGSSEFHVLRPAKGVLSQWLYLCVTGHDFRNWTIPRMTGTGGLQRIPRSIIEGYKIPLPPLEVQREIVAEIEGYQRVIDGARAVVDNWKPHVAVDLGWPEITIGECCAVKGGKRLPKGQQLSNEPTPHPYIRVIDLKNQSVRVEDVKFITPNIYKQISRYTISSNDVYISIAGTIGLMGTIPPELDGANLTENAAKLIVDKTRIDKRFLAAIGNSDAIQDQIQSLTHAVGVPKLALYRIKSLRLPIPPLEAQRAIVEEIEAERAAVDANLGLIERMEARIAAAIGRVWGE